MFSVNRLQRRLATLDGVDYKLEAVFGELHVIRNELKGKVGRDEFVLLEKRVMALEKKVVHQDK